MKPHVCMLSNQFLKQNKTMKNLILVLIMLFAFNVNAQVEPQFVDVQYAPDVYKEFDLNQPVKHSAEFRAVVQNDNCLTTLMLRDLYLLSVTKDDLRAQNNIGYERKLSNAEQFENDFIKLSCNKDAFLRYKIMKSNNYKLLNAQKYE